MTNEAKALQVWIEGSILGAPYLREAMSHAQTDLMASDGSLLTIGWQRGRMHTANAATVTSCEAAK